MMFGNCPACGLPLALPPLHGHVVCSECAERLGIDEVGPRPIHPNEPVAPEPFYPDWTLDRYPDADERPTCPHCAAWIRKPVTRGRKCRLCGLKYYVRRAPDGRRWVLDREGMHEVEDQWAEHDAEKPYFLMTITDGSITLEELAEQRRRGGRIENQRARRKPTSTT